MFIAKRYAIISLACLMLAACEGVDLPVDGAPSAGSAGTGADNGTIATGGNAATSSSAVPEVFDDVYLAELAQDFPAFVVPLEIGAAHDASENINLGRWGDLIEWPQIATGAAHLPDGRLLTWSSTRENNFGTGTAFTHGSIFDPITETFTDNPNPQHNMFCAGISMLPDGGVFAAGGGATVATTSIYRNGSWSLSDPLIQNRWYPHSTLLPSGQVVTSLGTDKTPFSEMWTDGEGWRTLTNASLQNVMDNTDTSRNLRDWFPALNVAPDGSLFHPGPTTELFSIDLYTNGDPLTSHGKREAGNPHRLYNTTVMYDIGKMLIAGGGKPALNSALTIDINGSTPVVTATEPMEYARSMQDSVVLPDGKVLVIGGNSSGVQFSDEGTQLFPEMWDPQTGQWDTLAPHSRPRNYHSTAMLLKDGRVAAMGSGLCGGCKTNQQNGEIYEPPYLFNPDGTRADRPSIISGASEASAGDSLSFTASAGIESFSMVKLVALTHHHSTDQRFIPLSFTESQAGSYSVQLPSNFNVLIPGYYWVFALDANGVPSVGHTVKINVTAPEVPEPPTSVAYEYFHGEWNALPDFDSLTPISTGETLGFNLGPRIQDDNFAFRFTATLNVEETGEYTFYTSSDDGSALFVNGEMVVDNDGLHGSREEEGTISLTAGSHEIVVTYFEQAGGNTLVVQMEGPGITKRPLDAGLLPLDGVIVPVDLGIPTTPANPATPANPTTAVNPDSATIAYDYYEGAWTVLPDFSSLTPVLSGELTDFTTDPKRQNQFYGFRYTTTLYAPTAEDYTFYLSSDDGSALYVNGQLVVDNDGLHSLRERQGTVSLGAGQHDIVVEFFQRTGGAGLGVEVEAASVSRQAFVPSIAPAVVPANPATPAPVTPNPAAPGGNLLSNGNFAGGLDDWASCGGVSTANTGSATLSGGGCLFQEFNITPQAQYTLSCEASAASGFASMQLSVSDASFVSLASDPVVVPNGGTTTISASVSAPDGGAIGVVTLYAETQADFDNCVVTVDDSSVVPVTVEPVDNNVLQNANFEDGLDDWFACGGTQTLTAEGVDGSNAVNLSNAGCLFQEFAVTPGESYKLNCTGQSEVDFTSMTLIMLDSNFQQLDTQEVAITGNTFEVANASLTAPAGAVFGAVTLYADTDGTFDSCGVIN